MPEPMAPTDRMPAMSTTRPENSTVVTATRSCSERRQRSMAQRIQFASV
jgi:hypothetical protein